MRLFRYLTFVPKSVLTKRRAEIGMGVAGIGALITPLLLWVAWSPEMLRIVLIQGFGCMFLAIWFAQYAAPDSWGADDDPTLRPGLDDADLAETGEMMKVQSWRDVT